MTRDPDPPEPLPVVAALRDAEPVADERPAGPLDRPPDLDIEITNLARGQVVAMHVRGPWTEEELERRLLRFVSVRQPADLRVVLEGTDEDDEPPLRRARAAIEAFGGSLTVGPTPPDSVAPGLG